ncbi:MAG: hypothetical protein BMS9Abin20_1456 [Acidimicrobiia bacterium]|nr:MAG: hypothetical protein BMS9Abin20_1456 [Acidimicrobiia bacterium]
MSRKQQSRQQRRRHAQRGSRGSKTRTWWIVGGIGVVALVAVLAAFGLSGNSGVPMGPRADVSTTPSTDVSTAPVSTARSAAVDVVLQDFDGNPVTVSSLEGQPVVVNFWASWCPACFAEMPAFEKVYLARRDSVQFLGINLTEDVEPALAVVEQTGVTYPLARDPQGEAFAAFGGYGMPTTIFLDETGRVIELYTGELTADELEARIVEYFGG